MNDFDLLRPTLAFATVVDLGSFRAAAEFLQLSPPYVSQLVSELEVRLGKQLLYRSTRQLSLTAEGEAFLPHARRMSEAFREGIGTVRDGRRGLRGRLSVSAPTVLASPLFAQLIAGFAARHPDVRLDLDLDDRHVDPVAARVDLVLRIGDSGDDPRLGRKLFATRGVICCRSDLARSLRNPGDLVDLTWLRSPASAPRLQLCGPDGEVTRIDPRSRISINNASLIRTMLAEGAGFALMPEFAIRDAVSRDLFTIALPGWSLPDVPVTALFTERRTALTNARAFADLIQATIAGKRHD